MKDAILNRLFLRYREHGDGRALAAVFDLTSKELLAVAAHLARGAGEAEDLVQIVFLRAMERARTFDAAAGLRPWLHGILWREALAARRRAARRWEPEALAREGSADPAKIALERELPAAVRAALDGLPWRYREVVEPLLLEEKPAHEIAAALGRSSGTVRMQIHRGLEHLRRALPRGFSACGMVVLPTRGWEELRRCVLREAGVASQAVGALSTGALVTQAAFAVAPALWLAPLVAGGAALVATHPHVLPFPSRSNEPAPIASRASDPKEPRTMKPSSLLALPVALGLSTSPAVDPPGKEPLTVLSVEDVEDKVAALDALIGELITITEVPSATAATAWAGLLAARDRIDAEAQRRTEQGQNPLPALTRQWVEALSQLADPARRELALDEIAAALVSNQEDRQIAACGALTMTWEVEYDKQGFCAPVRSLAQYSSRRVRVFALDTLYNIGRQPGDLALVLPLVDDPDLSVAEEGLYLLIDYSDGDLTGETGEAALRILERLDDRGLREAMGLLSGARVSPAIEELVLAHPSSDAFYCFSTFANKSRAVVERLAERAFDLAGPVYACALEGLGHGVPPEHGPVVAEAMQRLFEARSSTWVRTEALRLVGQYGTTDYLPWLRQIAGDAEQRDSVRAAARAAEDSILAR
jgi:RNA polymerase sigma-70 factor (ECF subfamily)